MSGLTAPIALFIYRRPLHTRKTIESLQLCPEFEASPVYVFADGPKSGADLEAVRAARKTAHDLLGDRANYVEQGANHGLAASVISGVTDVCERHGKVIVVEDDLIVASNFLTFMNEALTRYEGESRVMQVSGHMFDVPELADSSEALFLPFTTSWGWATWQRAWDKFDPEVADWRLILQDTAVRKRFNLNGHYPYSRMLKKQMDGQIDSWAIRWYYSVFRNDGVVLYPPYSLVTNIGMDGSGTHTHSPLSLVKSSLGGLEAPIKLPDGVDVQDAGLEAVFSAVERSTRKPPSLLLAEAIRKLTLRLKESL